MRNKKDKSPLLSIIIPCFNEEKTIELIIKKILKIRNINKQLIVIRILHEKMDFVRHL